MEIAKIAPSVGAENRITRGTDGLTINGPNYLTYKILQVSSTFHYLCHASVGK